MKCQATPIFSKQKGFTLVELLVVIAIIGILATLVLLQLGGARAKARDTQRISTVSQIHTALEQYFSDNNAYPVAATWAALCTALKPKYLSQCPSLGPTGAATDVYNYAYSTTQAHVWAELETKSTALGFDADIDSSAAGWVGGNRYNASVATTEACTAAYASGTARDCIYDRGTP